MSWIKRLASSLRARKLEEDLDRELEFHLSMRTSEKASAGISPDDARRQAENRFGSVMRAKEDCRDQSTLAWIAALRQDVHYAARNLRSHPGFTAAAVACMALGIGANAAIFSFVNAFLFQALPPGVVMVQRASGNPISFPEYQDWRRLNRVFDDVFAYTPGERFTIGHSADAGQALGETVAGSYFQTQGVFPFAGRLLTADDETGPLAVISHDFWRTRFSGDPTIVGKTISINRDAFTIVGIAPPGFHGMLAPWSTDVWVTPYLHRDTLRDRRTGWIMTAARLKPGIALRQAEAAMNSLDSELARQYPDLAPQGAGSQGRRDALVVARRGGLSASPVWFVFTVMAVLLMAVTGIIFLIACANVAGLLVARALLRRREILIRLSLGASRSRLVRQFLAETLLLGLLGAAVGIALAYAAGDALAGLMPQSISGGFRFQHGIDWHVLAFTLALSLASAVLSGLLPALRASKQNLAVAGKTHTAVGSRTPRLRNFLVVAQVAASVLVLATSGLFVRSFLKAQKTDIGFDSGHLLTVDIDLRQRKYPPAKIAELYSQLRDRVADIPGVASVSFADVLPLGSTRVANIPDFGEVATATVGSRYFDAMGIRLVRGREPLPDERDVAVVNEALAQRLWPNQDPIGKTVTRRLVIAVAVNSKYWSLNEAPRPFLYRIAAQSSDSQLFLAIRANGSPKSLATRVGREVQVLNPDLPEMSIRTGEETLHTWLEPQRAAALMLSLLGMAALGLATTGLYALLAQTVAQRAPEIAVRIALGATRTTVVGMLLRQAGLLIFAGTSLGIAASAGVARLLATLAGQVSPLDGAIMLAVAVLLAAVGTAAMLVPAYRALRIDPASALRSD
jgi:predicted permease